MNSSQIEFIAFQNKYANDFCKLNMEWLETFFYVEEHDREVLENCQEYIIDKGGHIFFAKIGPTIVGCVALMNEAEGIELSKMAVDPKFRGLGIGQKLMEYCIDFAKSKEWNGLHLYSNRILENSIHIYKKYGFKEVDIGSENPYARGNIKMRLVF